jgi:hypothetical protein
MSLIPSSGGGVQQVAAGTNVTITGTAAVPIVNATAGGGGVTSVTGGTGIAISGTPTVPEVVAAPIALSIGQGPTATPGPLPGSISFTLPQAGTLIQLSAAFTVAPAAQYRFTLNFGFTSTTATQGFTQIGIRDAAGSVVQLVCWNKDNTYLASNYDAGSISGIFQPGVTSVAFWGFTNGSDDDIDIVFQGGAGASPFQFFLERLT